MHHHRTVLTSVAVRPPRTRGGPTAPLVQGQQPGSSPVGCTTAPSAACAQDTTTRQQPHRRRVSMPPPARPRSTNRRCTAATCRSCPRVLTGPLSTLHFSYARSLRQYLSMPTFKLARIHPRNSRADFHMRPIPLTLRSALFKSGALSGGSLLFGVK